MRRMDGAFERRRASERADGSRSGYYPHAIARRLQFRVVLRNERIAALPSKSVGKSQRAHERIPIHHSHRIQLLIATSYGFGRKFIVDRLFE